MPPSSPHAPPAAPLRVRSAPSSATRDVTRGTPAPRIGGEGRTAPPLGRQCPINAALCLHVRTMWPRGRGAGGCSAARPPVSARRGGLRGRAPPRGARQPLCSQRACPDTAAVLRSPRLTPDRSAAERRRLRAPSAPAEREAVCVDGRRPAPGARLALSSTLLPVGYLASAAVCLRDSAHAPAGGAGTCHCLLPHRSGSATGSGFPRGPPDPTETPSTTRQALRSGDVRAATEPSRSALHPKLSPWSWPPSRGEGEEGGGPTRVSAAGVASQPWRHLSLCLRPLQPAKSFSCYFFSPSRSPHSSLRRAPTRPALSPHLLLFSFSIRSR